MRFIKILFTMLMMAVTMTAYTASVNDASGTTSEGYCIENVELINIKVLQQSPNVFLSDVSQLVAIPIEDSALTTWYTNGTTNDTFKNSDNKLYCLHSSNVFIIEEPLVGIVIYQIKDIGEPMAEVDAANQPPLLCYSFTNAGNQVIG